MKEHFASQNPKIDETDGLSMEFKDWRMNIRGSNTEPLLRLNIETEKNESLVLSVLKSIKDLILSLSADADQD